MKLILALALLAASPAWAAPILLGVLEEPQCKKETPVSVRALFVYEGGKWRAPDTEGSLALPPNATWVVAFDGRKVGTVKTIDREAKKSFGWTYSRDRLLALAPNQSPPTVPNGKEQFAGWCDAPKNRPLVVLSKDNSSDPDHWKPGTVKQDTVRRLFPDFRKRAGEALICPENAESGVPFTYSIQDLEEPVAYTDQKGRQLVSLRLKRELNTCDGPAGIGWDNHVFVLNPTIEYVGAGLSLVDAGDYDSDGRSDLLFWFSAYNRDGYSLLSTDLKQRANYLWGYH